MSYFFHSQPLLFCLSLGVGGVHGDGIPRMQGYSDTDGFGQLSKASYGGVMKNTTLRGQRSGDMLGGSYPSRIEFDSATVLAATAKVQPRAWGALACCYMGATTS